MRRSFGIRVAACRFRQDNRGFYIDRAANTISDALTSIKHIGRRTAQKLFEWRGRQYKTFSDLLADMEFDPAFDSQAVDILIRLGYFQEFGSAGKLLKVHAAFREGEIRFSKAHVPATRQKRLTALRAFERSLEESGVPLAEQIRSEVEYAGAPLTVCERERDLYAVLDVDERYSPKLRLYSVSTGRTGVMKVKKPLFRTQPLKGGDMLRILDWQRRPAYQYIDGKPCPRPGVSELWLEAYEKI